ncbi:MAG: hypothetical protein JJU00_03200 [Opitutales bacterium]|nr:hypothetical protein [Opitutales bacterium]
MKITKIKFFGGSKDKVCRLGLAHTFLELQEILIATDIRILDKKQANSAGVVREMMDAHFGKYPEWVQSKSGDIDWVKRFRHNQTVVSRIGVEIQVSDQSDFFAHGIVQIRNKLQDSHIDVGIIVVPSDDFGYRMTGRVANYSYAVQYVEEELREAKLYPIVLIAVENDGFSDTALPKETMNLGKAS